MPQQVTYGPQTPTPQSLPLPQGGSYGDATTTEQSKPTQKLGIYQTRKGGPTFDLQKDVESFSSNGRVEGVAGENDTDRRDRIARTWKAMTDEQRKTAVQGEARRGGSAGEMELGAFGGLLGGLPGAMAGGAAGGALKHEALKGTGQTPPRDLASEMFRGAGVQGLFDVGGKFGGMALGKIAGLFAGKISSRDAATIIADGLSNKALSREQFGSALQNSFDMLQKAAGAAKGDIVGKYANTIVPFPNALKVVNEEIDGLIAKQQLSPGLFAKVENKASLGNTLDVLTELKTTLEGAKDLKTADMLRSDIWKYRNLMEPSTSSRILGALNKAMTDDVAHAIPGADSMRYIRASNRYGELKDMTETDVLKRLFSDNRVAGDKVVAAMMTAPEASLKAIRTLNPGYVKQAQRAIFEDLFNRGELANIDPSVMRELFGTEAPKITKFGDMLSQAQQKSGISDKMLSYFPGRAGALAKFAIKGINGNPVAEIPAARMAQLMGQSPAFRDAIIQAFQSKPTQQGIANLLRLLSSRVFSDENTQPDVPSENQGLMQKFTENLGKLTGGAP